MAISIRTLFKVFVFALILFPSEYLCAQETTSPTLYESSSVQEDMPFEKEKKKKKKKDDNDADFFVPGVEKLSASFFVRLLIDLFSVLLLIRFIYYPIYRKKDFFFTFFLFNVTIFIITHLLNKVDLSMGAAFGLFAVFSLLRYRTEDISAKDMTYLFVVIAIGLISAVNKGTFIETSIINLIVITVAYALDGNLFIKNESAKKIQYENIELIKPENHEQLLADLRKRTGLNIHKISIDRIDFLRDTATIIVYYYDVSGSKANQGR